MKSLRGLSVISAKHEHFIDFKDDGVKRFKTFQKQSSALEQKQSEHKEAELIGLERESKGFLVIETGQRGGDLSLFVLNIICLHVF